MADKTVDEAPAPDVITPESNDVEADRDRPPVSPYDPYFGSRVTEDFNWASD